MLNRYNIALIPLTQGVRIIKLAKKFAGISESYLLGNKSFSHVTLCQFMQTESALEELWKKVSNALKPHFIELEFREFSFFENPHVYWISLKPDKIEVLKKMHSTVAKIIRKPLGRSFKMYDAHMTLVNTVHKDFLSLAKAVEKNYIPIKDTFYLALGKSDEVGQFKEIIYSHQPDMK